MYKIFRFAGYYLHHEVKIDNDNKNNKLNLPIYFGICF